MREIRKDVCDARFGALRMHDAIFFRTFAMVEYTAEHAFLRFVRRLFFPIKIEPDFSDDRRCVEIRFKQCGKFALAFRQTGAIRRMNTEGRNY